MKRIVSLAAIFAVAAATLFGVVAYAGSNASKTTAVSVTAKEFSFKLSRKSATHGKVSFKVTNKGSLQHDFKIAGKKTKLLGHNKSATLVVTLKKGKKYTYICTVPGHAQAGMKGTFKAT
jgi:plastocyanin